MPNTNATRNWPATQEFARDARNVERALAAGLKLVRSLQDDETTHGGHRTQRDVEALGDLMGYLQLFCEAAARLDGGALAREILQRH